MIKTKNKPVLFNFGTIAVGKSNISRQPDYARMCNVIIKSETLQKNELCLNRVICHDAGLSNLNN